MANLNLNMGDLEVARKYAQESHELAQQTQNKAMRIHSFLTSGQIDFASENYPASMGHYQAALKLGQQMEDPVAIGSSLDGVGRIFIEMGRLDDAARCLDKAWEKFEAVGSRQAMLAVLLSKAALTAHQGRHRDALD